MNGELKLDPSSKTANVTGNAELTTNEKHFGKVALIALAAIAIIGLAFAQYKFQILAHVITWVQMHPYIAAGVFFIAANSAYLVYYLWQHSTSNQDISQNTSQDRIQDNNGDPSSNLESSTTIKPMPPASSTATSSISQSSSSIATSSATSLYTESVPKKPRFLTIADSAIAATPKTQEEIEAAILEASQGKSAEEVVELMIAKEKKDYARDEEKRIAKREKRDAEKAAREKRDAAKKETTKSEPEARSAEQLHWDALFDEVAEQQDLEPDWEKKTQEYLTMEQRIRTKEGYLEIIPFALYGPFHFMMSPNQMKEAAIAAIKKLVVNNLLLQEQESKNSPNSYGKLTAIWGAEYLHNALSEKSNINIPASYLILNHNATEIEIYIDLLVQAPMMGTINNAKIHTDPIPQDANVDWKHKPDDTDRLALKALRKVHMVHGHELLSKTSNGQYYLSSTDMKTFGGLFEVGDVKYLEKNLLNYLHDRFNILWRDGFQHTMKISFNEIGIVPSN